MELGKGDGNLMDNIILWGYYAGLMGILCGTYYYTCVINFKCFFYGKSSNE